MTSLNKVSLIGNLGADPIIRTTQDGREIAMLSIATSESWKDKTTSEKKEKTEWHRVIVFTKGLVGVIKQYLKKGHKVYLEGSLQTRKWKDDKGVERYSTEVILQGFGSQLIMLSQNNNKDSNTPPIESYERDLNDGIVETLDDYDFPDEVTF